MVKDILGNELKVGDFVHLQLPSNLVLAKVAEIHDGGLIGSTSLNNSMQIPGSIMFNIEAGAQFDPKNPVMNVHKLLVPPDSPLLAKDKNAKLD